MGERRQPTPPPDPSTKPAPPPAPPRKRAEPSGFHPAYDNGEITVRELLDRIDAAVARMGAKNAHRDLLVQCHVAILALASQTPEPREVRTAGGIILP